LIVKDSARKVVAHSSARSDESLATSAARIQPPRPLAAAAEELERQKAVLEKENQELRRVAQCRSVLLAGLTHELRTPLTSILGFAEILLSQEELTKAQRNFCQRIQNSARQLQSSLGHLTDLSRLEAGRSDLLTEEFSLIDLLRESWATLERQALEQNAGLHWQAAADLPLIVSDRGKLRQVIYNLVAYAISRSPDGALVKATADKNARGFLIKVEDEGESLSDPAAIGELDSPNQRSGSSELGVAIARHNIDLLGARLSVRNREPQGLEVRIQLPARPLQTTRD
jgi:signal transduction histidine kinase